MPRESSPATSPRALAEAVQQCRRDSAFLAELADLLRQADTDPADRAGRCRACGDCCRFATAGHRLYASTGEIALLTSAPPPQPPRPLSCPYQCGDRCAAREARPLGCRAFFCEDPLTEPAGELYERFHSAIRRLHDAHHLPYRYAELTAALCDLARPSEGVFSD